MAKDSLDLFHECTKRWFLDSVGTPTKVQEEAWPAIFAGKDTLVTAPTGTGKTLSAFLTFIDRLVEEARNGELKQELQLIYISPLKSLAGDIRENLKKPLEGIQKDLKNEEVQVAIRTGDTTQSERHRMIKKPPHILITTPESLFLLLTSKTGKVLLSTAKYIIIDELHAFIDKKRGAHLMLSIARLDFLCNRHLQRIGLSATIRPLEVAAKYLSPEKVTIVAPKIEKTITIEVICPLENRNLPQKDTIWKDIAKTLYNHCIQAKSAIAFVEGRRQAEKLAIYINEIAGDGFARTHHGSLSKEQRFEVEESLRNGTLRLLCATSSMELGIDVGEIEEVYQVGCPQTISSTMQRLGRAGHNPNRISVMQMFPRTSSEGLYCGIMAKIARNGGIEYAHPPRLCFDILAQHLVSMATDTGYAVDDVVKILKRAYPFREVTKEDVKDVLGMLAGDYEHEQNIPVRPRIIYDRIHEWVEGDAYSRMLAVSTGGTIPDRGLYTVRTEEGVKVGEVDEEFIYESRVGERFLLGTFAWQIAEIKKDAVTVRQATASGAKLPFWKGDLKGRAFQTGVAIGQLFEKLQIAYESNQLNEQLEEFGLNKMAREGAADFIKRQIDVTKVLPNHKTIIIEHFKDENSNWELMIHAVYGKMVNTPLAILLTEEAKKQTKINISYMVDDDGILLFPYESYDLPEGLIEQIVIGSVRQTLEALLPVTPIFSITFRYNIARALMMGIRKNGRQPLWLQRIRSAQMLESLVTIPNHPLMRETVRECLEDNWDIESVIAVLEQIKSREIMVYEIHSEYPSLMSLPLRQQVEAEMMYDYTPTPIKVQYAAMERLKATQMITPTQEHLQLVTERKRIPEDEKQLHTLLMVEGDLVAGEVFVPVEWLESLIKQEVAAYIEPGLWIAAEQQEKYEKALKEEDEEAQKSLIQRLLRYKGEQSIISIQQRYLWKKETIENILQELCKQEKIIEKDGIYYDATLYERACKATIQSLRNEIQTLPPHKYAILLCSFIRRTQQAKEQLKQAILSLCGKSFAPELWEKVILPGRVSNYRPELLDALLAEGDFYWRFSKEEGVSFQPYERIDWEIDQSSQLCMLTGEELAIYRVLLKQGACFMKRLAGVVESATPYDTLLQMLEKGFVCADSFLPIRQFLSQDKEKKENVRHRVNQRVQAMNSGRWEIVRSLRSQTVEEILEQLFDQEKILCRETIRQISWATALETLRVWEFTGRVRRGYFIEGLSGIQFIRQSDFENIMLLLKNESHDILWLPAIDPNQPWGKSLPHIKGREFINNLSTVVALYGGQPVAVFEKQGKTLRVFDETIFFEVIQCFLEDFRRHCIYGSVKRIVIKEYPTKVQTQLVQAGFRKEMKDYVYYR